MLFSGFTKRMVRLMCGLILVCALIVPSCKTTNNNRVYETPTINLTYITKVESIPNFGNAVQISTEEWFTPEETSDAMFVFYATWLSTFGDPEGKLLDALANLVVMWEPSNWKIKSKTTFDEEGNENENGEVWISGLAQSKHFIQVSADADEIYDTSLTHELIHIALWHLVPESMGDADHQGDKYPGWTARHSALKDLVNITLAKMKEQD